MTPADVAALIEDQTRAGWDQGDPNQNPHGIDLERCLVKPPEVRTFLDSFDSNRPIVLWLVLSQEPEGAGGYRVVFSEERREFGLAVRGDGDHDVLIGYYGSLPDTLAGM